RLRDGHQEFHPGDHQECVGEGPLPAEPLADDGDGGGGDQQGQPLRRNPDEGVPDERQETRIASGRQQHEREPRDEDGKHGDEEEGEPARLHRQAQGQKPPHAPPRVAHRLAREVGDKRGQAGHAAPSPSATASPASQNQRKTAKTRTLTATSPGPGPASPATSPRRSISGVAARKAQKSTIRAAKKLPRPPKARATRRLSAASP